MIWLISWKCNAGINTLTQAYRNAILSYLDICLTAGIQRFVVGNGQHLSKDHVSLLNPVIDLHINAASNNRPRKALKRVTWKDDVCTSFRNYLSTGRNNNRLCGGQWRGSSENVIQ